MDEPTDVSLDSSVQEEILEEDLKENKIKQSKRRRSSKRSRGNEDSDEPEKVDKRSSRRSKKTRADEEEDTVVEDPVVEEPLIEVPVAEEPVAEEPVAEEVSNGNNEYHDGYGEVETPVVKQNEAELAADSAPGVFTEAHEVVEDTTEHGNVVNDPVEQGNVAQETAQAQSEDTAMEAQNDDEVVEVQVPGKQKPEMIVLDDINDDDGPGPDEVPTAEERGFWKAVEENPNDFASWTYLLQVVEKNGKLKQIQKAFSSFLALYPYCYGYWKKYADQMKKIVSNEAAFQVYNDAVIAIPLSVDLWTYFIHFIAEWKDGDENEIRTIYQRAVEACGQDYRSDKIWEAYVEWEKQTDKYRVLKLYKQFLGCVIQRHQYHFDKFREWIFFTPVKDMVTMEDIKELLTRHKVEAERRRLETEKKIKEEEELARVAAEEAAKLAEEQRKQAEEEEAKIQEDIKRMQEEQKMAVFGDEAPGTEEATMEGIEELAPEVEELAPEVEEYAPGMEESAPGIEESAPGIEESAPGIEEPAPEEEAAKEEAQEEMEENVVDVNEEAAEETKEEEQTEAVVQMTEDFNKVDMEEPLPDSPEALTAKQEAAIREQMLLDMAPIHEKILTEIEEVTTFEDGIKRPYFHVKELERVQLKNWKNYLNVVIEKKDVLRTITLFERCLIACAFYEGFWIKYINFMNAIDKEETSKIYRRACMVHLVKKPYVHLNWAAFEEERGCLEVAREALDHIDKGMPGLIAVILRRAGLERRSGNIEQGGDILKLAIENCRGRETRDFWIMKFVGYLQYSAKDIPAARKFLTEQIERNPRNKKLYVRLLDLEHSSGTNYPNSAAVVSVFDKALTSSLTIEEKAGFSHRRLTFLEEFGDDVSAIISAYDDHNKNWKTVLDEKKKESSVPPRDYKRRDNYNHNRNYNRDRGYNRDRNYNHQSNYNQNNNFNNQAQGGGGGGGGGAGGGGGGGAGGGAGGGFNMNYNMQHAQQQQQYQQWYSQYAQQQQFAAQGQQQQPQYQQPQQNRGY